MVTWKRSATSLQSEYLGYSQPYFSNILAEALVPRNPSSAFASDMSDNTDLDNLRVTKEYLERS